MLTAILLLAVTASPHASRDASPAVLAAFDALRVEAAAQSDSRGGATSLLKKVENARAAYVRGERCAAVNVLNALGQEAAAQRDHRPSLEALFASARRLRQMIQADEGGGACADPRLGRAPAVMIGESTNERLTLRLTLGEAVLRPLTGDGELFTDVTVPGLVPGSAAPGAPEIATWRHLIAVPKGASARVSGRIRPAESIHVNLYPYQPFAGESSLEVDRFLDTPPPPELFRGAPFTKDAEAYARNRTLPPDPCHVKPLGDARDLRVALLECAGGQYNAVTDRLTLFGTIDVDVAFEGGEGIFVTSAAFSPFERLPGVYTGAVLNKDAVARYVGKDVTARICSGEELLILTAPDFLAQANALAAWKASRGIPTRVVSVNDGAGAGPDTNEEIDAYIHDRYAKCLVRPSYILLFGDTPAVPTWMLQRNLYPDGTLIASDFPYATLDTDPDAPDFIPDFAVGRIPVATAAEAQIVIDKIMKYEATPPFVPSFYRNIGLASYFQCCRTDVMGVQGVEDGRAFILNAEFLRNTLMGEGYDVDRIYTTKVANPDDYTADPTPRRFADQTMLPADLLAPYPWDGDAADVLAAIDAGRTLFFHLDHGYTGGWGNPAFSTAHVDQMTNGDLTTVLFNFNCSSGGFDSPIAFSEKLLRKSGGGAVGVFGWTRMSNTAYYRSLIEGTLGALWPSTLPSYGDGTVKPRLGDLFDFAKIYMAYQHASWNANAPDAPNTLNHVRLYHFFGDPTMEVRTAFPYELPRDIVLIPIDPFDFEIRYAEDGAVITLWQQSRDGMVPLGRAVVHDGTATLSLIQARDPALPLHAFATKPNALGRAFGPPAGEVR